MSSGNNDTMDQEPPQATTETLQPLVDMILAQLTATQWVKVTSGSVDDNTKAVITDMCVDIVNAVSKIVLEAFKNRLAQRSKTPPESPEMISEDEVQKYLGNSITDAFVNVTGSPVPTRSAQRLTDLVSKEVTERINSQLSVSSRGSESKITRRLQIMAKHVIGMLKNCKAKVSCASSSRTVDSQSPDTAAESTSPAEQESLREQTPVSPIGPEDRCSVGSFMDTTTEAVKQILLEHVSDPEVKSNADISEEEHLRIVNSINEDADEAACEIAHYIWSNREEFGLNNDGTPGPEAQSSRLNCWNVVANKIKVLFARKFAKKAIASFMVKLRTKLNFKKASLDVLIPAAEKVVQDMIPAENPDDCTYKTMAICINNGQHEAHSQQLGHIIFENLQRDLGARKVDLITIQMEVDKFMKTMWNWLNQQAQKLTKKNNRVDDSLKRIRVVLDLPELPEDTVTPVESAAPSTTAESGVNGDKDIISPVTEVRSPSITAEPGDEDISISPVPKLRSPSITAEPGDEDISISPVPKLRSPSITAEPGDEDISISPVPKLRSPSITAEPGVSDEGNSITPVCDRSAPIADKDDENLSPKVESTTLRDTAEPALSDRSQPTEPAELYHSMIAIAVVHQCTKKAPISVTNDEKKKMISILKDMLRTSGVDFKSIQPTGQQIKKTARAVLKDLCALKGSKHQVALNLQSQDSLVYQCVTETVTRHLLKPKKSIKESFISLFHTVTKPFTSRD